MDNLQNPNVVQKKRHKDMTKEEKLEYGRQCSAAFRKRRKEAGLSSRGGAPPLRIRKTGKVAEQNRIKAKRHHDKLLALDPEATREEGRQHQQSLRWKAAGGPVGALVSTAIRNILIPYRKADTVRRRIPIDVTRARERKQTDPAYASRCRVRSRINSWLKLSHPLGKLGKSATTFKMVGCTQVDFYDHLRQQRSEFNPSTHEIDHIFPLYSYNIIDNVQQLHATHFSNSQPLCISENRWKSNKLPTKAMAVKVDRDKWPPGITEDMLPDIYPGWATPLRMCVAPPPGEHSSTGPVDHTCDVSWFASEYNDSDESVFSSDEGDS
jgi:hypothetical protein